LNAEELELTQAMAHQATLAIQLTTLAARAGESALAEERVRFSRDIHDTLAQGFTGILMQLGAASQVKDDHIRSIETHLKAIEDLARSSLAEARRSVRALRPSAPTGDSLLPNVDKIVATIRAQTDADLLYTVDGTPEMLGAEVESELGRIVQESLHNIVKHARATKISLSIEFQGRRSIRICVKDDGRGFDSSQKPAEGKFGLIGMQERAASIGASLTIISEKGRGTQIVLQHSEASWS
jgi:signal transduction histidine kinase